jgi:hypothetical protein
MTRATGRTAPCDRADARTRLRRAQEFLAAAELVLGERGETRDEEDAINLSGVSAALAVLAGIAASDAATCFRLGKRSRSQDHREAVDLLRSVAPGGELLAKDLARLLDLKDTAHYGVLGVSGGEAAKAVEWARRMVTGVRDIAV